MSCSERDQSTVGSTLNTFTRNRQTMSLPKKMNDEQLHVFGYTVLEDDPTRAKHRKYRSFRHRCSSCKLWDNTQNGQPPLCKACFSKSKSAPLSSLLETVYLCCGHDSCETWNKVRLIFQEHDLSINMGGNGNGEYLRINIPETWSQNQRDKFHIEINTYCCYFSDFNARKVQCKTTGKQGSKLPTSL